MRTQKCSSQVVAIQLPSTMGEICRTLSIFGLNSTAAKESPKEKAALSALKGALGRLLNSCQLTGRATRAERLGKAVETRLQGTESHVYRLSRTRRCPRTQSYCIIGRRQHGSGSVAGLLGKQRWNPTLSSGLNSLSRTEEY